MTPQILETLVLIALLWGGFFFIRSLLLPKQESLNSDTPKEKPCPPHKWNYTEYTNEYGEECGKFTCEKCGANPSA